MTIAVFSSQMRRGSMESYLEAVCLILALAQVAAVATWVVEQPYPSLQDYLQWVYLGHIFAALIKGDPVATEAFRFAAYPIPNTVAQLILGLLSLVLPPLVAARLLILTWLGCFSVLVVLLARHVTYEHWGKLALVLVSCGIINSAFWNGYIAFQLSLLFFGIFLYLWIAKAYRSGVVIFAWSILLFFTHAATFATFSLFVATAELTRNPNKLLTLPRAKTIAAFVPVLLLAAWYVVAKVEVPVDVMLGREVGKSILQIAAYKVYSVMKLGPFHLLQRPDKSWFVAGGGYLYWVGVAINGLFAVFLVVGIAWGLVLRVRDIGLHRNLGLIAFTGISLAMFGVAPQLLGGIVNLGERFLNAALIVILLMLMLPIPFLRVLALLTMAGTVYTLSFIADPYLLAPTDPSKRSSATDLFFTHRLHDGDGYGAVLRNPAGQPAQEISFLSSIILRKENPDPSTPDSKEAGE